MSSHCGLHRFCQFGLQLFVGLFVLAPTGCMQFPRAPQPPRWLGPSNPPVGDPFLNSPQFNPPQPVPQQQPALAPTPADTIPQFDDSTPVPTFRDDFSAPVPVESNRPVPVPFELSPNLPIVPETTINPNVEPPRLEAPTIVPQAVTVPPTLGLDIKAPENNIVGELTVFEVTLQNTGDRPAVGVVIESRFEDGFIFPGSDDRQVNQTIGDLAAGESRDIKLSLRSDRAGYHCVEFTLKATGAKPQTEKVCVEYKDASLSLKATGPTKRMVGGNAEWNLTILSRDFLTVTNASVVLDYDSTYLKPVGGSEGAKQDFGRITWPLGSVQASERVELQVEFECLMPIDSTCLTFTVTADDRTEQIVKECLAIERRVGALEIDLQDTPDPVQTGQETEYVITITNRELRSVHDIQLTAKLPGLFRAMTTEVREGRLPLTGVTAGVEGSLVRFDSVDVLAPDAKLTYRIKVKALQAGTDRLLLSVSSDDTIGGKIRLEEVTTVVN